MKKEIIAILLAAVLMTACGDMPYTNTNVQGTVVEPEVNAEVLRTADAKTENEQVREESETVQEPAASGESGPGRGLEANEESETVQGLVTVEESEACQESEAVQESEARQGAEAVQESAAASAHVCRMDSGSTVTVLAFGEHEPDCFYGAKYDVKCVDCGKCLDVIYRGSLGHAADEGVVTCQPDCTGGGSIKYTCIRCGTEWSETCGQVQPHTWVEGIRKETDWDNGGTKEVPYLYCSVCGKREENE